MEANMQRMAGAGQMMQQPMRKPQPSQAQIQQLVYQNLVSHAQQFTAVSWQAGVNTGDRMGRVMNL